MCKILHTVLSQDKFCREFTHFLDGCVKRYQVSGMETGESVQSGGSGDTGDSFGTDESGEWGESGDAGDSRESNETGDAVKYFN